MSLRRNLRLIVFTVLTVFVGLLYGYAATLLPVPWAGTADGTWDPPVGGV